MCDVHPTNGSRAARFSQLPGIGQRSPEHDRPDACEPHRLPRRRPSAQGVGLGESLLQHALLKGAEASRIIGARAFIVDLLKDDAERFYSKFGLHVDAACEQACDVSADQGRRSDISGLAPCEVLRGSESRLEPHLPAIITSSGPTAAAVASSMGSRKRSASVEETPSSSSSIGSDASSM